MKTSDRPVALVTFGYEIFAAWIPMCVCSENGDLGANIMRGMEPAFTQVVRDHRRGGGLSVHANDDDAALARHDGSQRFGAAHHRFARFARADQNGIVDLDRRGKNDQLGVLCLIAAMLLVKMQSEPL